MTTLTMVKNPNPTSCRIVVPTCKKVFHDDLTDMAYQLGYNKSIEMFPVIFSCLENESAAANRNHCLKKCNFGDFIIMIDDDISGFTPMWAYHLIVPLKNPHISLVSARLLNPDGSKQPVMGGQLAKEEGVIEVERCPSAAIAFRNDGILFDENFIGSGWEDTDFCDELKERYPKSRFVINNNVKLIHKNEQKNQLGENWIKNRSYYNIKRHKHES